MQQQKDIFSILEQNISLKSLQLLSECSNGHKTTHICSSEGCNSNALMCSNSQCSYSTLQHNSCYSKITIQKFVNVIQDQKRQVPAIIENMFDLVIKEYDNMIEKVSQNRYQFIDYASMFGLNQQSIDIMSLINEGKLNQIIGQNVFNAIKMTKETATIYSPLRIPRKQSIKKSQVHIESLLNNIAQKLSEPALKLEMIIKKLGKNKQANLRLDCRYNNWQYIPQQIATFTYLQQLDLSHNKFNKIANLETLTKLKVLYMRDNNIEKIQGLETLVNLRGLFLRSNSIEKIQGLQTLTNLVQLQLGDNQIQEIEGLQTLVNLQLLELGLNQISKLTNLGKLTKLSKLYLYQNPLIEVEQQQQKMKQLVSKGVYVVIKGWRNSK